MPLGIPVRREFAQPYDRLEVAGRLGLDSKLHYILITGGSIGAGKLVRAVKVLDKRYHRDRTVKQSDDCEMIHRQHAVINARALEDICDYMEQ